MTGKFSTSRLQTQNLGEPESQPRPTVRVHLGSPCKPLISGGCRVRLAIMYTWFVLRNFTLCASIEKGIKEFKKELRRLSPELRLKFCQEVQVCFFYLENFWFFRDLENFWFFRDLEKNLGFIKLIIPGCACTSFYNFRSFRVEKTSKIDLHLTTPAKKLYIISRYLSPQRNHKLGNRTVLEPVTKSHRYFWRAESQFGGDGNHYRKKVHTIGQRS